MKITVMWMTRKRSHELIYSLSSFIHKANDNKNVEYIIALDPDDNETLNGLEKIYLMSQVDDANISYCVSEKRYGYEELEQYQNMVGNLFTGDCLLIMNDDIICLTKGWDDEVIKVVEPTKEKPCWIGLSGLNESWKGSTTFVGINRKWYDVTNRVSGNRGTDGYISDLGKALNLEPLKPKLDMIHLQRGKGTIEYQYKGREYKLHGLPDDGAGGYPTASPIPPKYYHNPNEFQNPNTDFVEGKKRFDEDFNNLKQWFDNE